MYNSDPAGGLTFTRFAYRSFLYPGALQQYASKRPRMGLWLAQTCTAFPCTAFGGSLVQRHAMHVCANLGNHAWFFYSYC